MEGIQYYLSSKKTFTEDSEANKTGSSIEKDKTDWISVNGKDFAENNPDYATTAMPTTVFELNRQVSEYFCEYKIINIFYKDIDNDLVTIMVDQDLQAAYNSGYKVKNHLQLYIKAIKPSSQILASPIKGSESLLDQPPQFIKDCYFVPCYKCQQKNEYCHKCLGSGMLDAYEDPNLITIRSIIRKEMENYLPKLLNAISEENSTAIHNNVSCNNCGLYPIIGHRFKCSVCINFDFCQVCEKNTFHEHPFIKIRFPELAPKMIFCAVNEKKKNFKPKNRQCEPQTRLLCRFVRDVIGNEGDIHSPEEVFIKS
jgi:Zinc finger, ZZ type./PB1 domain.